jgi:hypothetical protein
MSTHIRCPSCGQPASDTAYPDECWGSLYDGRELDLARERAPELSTDDVSHYSFCTGEGRQTFECPCGSAVWVASRDEPVGRWFVRHTSTCLIRHEYRKI